MIGQLEPWQLAQTYSRRGGEFRFANRQRYFNSNTFTFLYQTLAPWSWNPR